MVLGQYGDARRCIGEAMTSAETTGETWFEADIHRIAGEIEMLSPERDAAKAKTPISNARSK
jgi:predicted ATPase